MSKLTREGLSLTVYKEGIYKEGIMKSKIVSILVLTSIFIMIFLVLGCNGVTPRPSAYEGSAHWAFEKAQPEINNFDLNAELYWVMGAAVWKDGCLPANTGSWSFTCWSSSRQEICCQPVARDDSLAVLITQRFEYFGAIFLRNRVVAGTPFRVIQGDTFWIAFGNELCYITF